MALCDWLSCLDGYRLVIYYEEMLCALNHDKNGTDPLKKLILEKATEFFLTYSYSNTTMQHISGVMGISKKTLYKYFSSKEDLLLAVLKILQDELTASFEKIANNTELPFIEKLTELMQLSCTYRARLIPQMYVDIERIKPGLLANLNLLPPVKSLLQSGINEGLIRNDIDINLIILLIKSSLDVLISQKINPVHEFSLDEIIDAITKLFSEGLYTDQGRSRSKTISF